MKHPAKFTLALFICELLAAGLVLYWVANRERPPAPPAKPETLTCVRVKQVTPAGTINYLCEVRK